MPHTLLFIVLGFLVGHISLVEALSNIDNTSPLVVFTPTPCFQQNTSDCSLEWQLSENADDFNGSVTSTTGPLGLTVIPRVSLVFQGSSIIFVPGQDSTAQVTVVVDNQPPVLIDTASNVFSGMGLDPSTNHTITITFVPSPSLLPTTLEVDYFLIELPESTSTSSSSTSSSTSSSSNSSSTFTSTPLTTATPLPTSLSPTRSSALSTSTIAAISLSAALVLLLASVALFITMSRLHLWGKEQRNRDRDRDRRRRRRHRHRHRDHNLDLDHDLDHGSDRIERVERPPERPPERSSRERSPWREMGEERGPYIVLPPPHDFNHDHHQRVPVEPYIAEEAEFPREIIQRRERRREREAESMLSPPPTPHTEVPPSTRHAVAPSIRHAAPPSIHYEVPPSIHHAPPPSIHHES